MNKQNPIANNRKTAALKGIKNQEPKHPNQREWVKFSTLFLIVGELDNM